MSVAFGSIWWLFMGSTLTEYEDDLKKDPLGAEYWIFGIRYMVTPNRLAAGLALVIGLLLLLLSISLIVFGS